MPEGIERARLEVLARLSVPRRIEWAVHRRLAARAIVGEWYDLGGCPVEMFDQAVALSTGRTQYRPDGSGIRLARAAANRGRFWI